MISLHKGIDGVRMIAEVRLDNGDNYPIPHVDQLYVSEDGKHAVIHTVLPNGRRQIQTLTGVKSLTLVGA